MGIQGVIDALERDYQVTVTPERLNAGVLLGAGCRTDAVVQCYPRAYQSPDGTSGYVLLELVHDHGVAVLGLPVKRQRVREVRVLSKPREVASSQLMELGLIALGPSRRLMVDLRPTPAFDLSVTTSALRLP